MESVESFRLFQYAKNIGMEADPDFGISVLTQEKKIQELRDRLTSKTSDTFFPQLDDDFLLKFLRARKLNSDEAFLLVLNYYSQRKSDWQMVRPMGKGPCDYRHIYSLQTFTILPHRNPIDGSAVVICRKGSWYHGIQLNFFDGITPVLLCGDLLTDDIDVQEKGLTVICDLAGIRTSWVLEVLPPSIIPAALSTAQGGYPARLTAVHIVNQPAMYNVVFAIGKNFVKRKLVNKVHLHGENIKDLHKFIDPRILPKEYLGTQPEISNLWFENLLYKNHDLFVRNSYYGFRKSKKDSG